MKNYLPERLRQLREEKEWTQEQLGEILNVSGATVNRYEKGLRNPAPETLIKLAEIFNISLDYLLGRINFRQPDQAAEMPQKYHRNSEQISDMEEQLPDEARKELAYLKEYIIKKYRDRR